MFRYHFLENDISRKLTNKNSLLFPAGDNEEDLRRLTRELFDSAEVLECRSLAISSIEFPGIKKKKVGEIYVQSLQQRKHKHLKVVRFNENKKKLGAVFRELHKLVKTCET